MERSKHISSILLFIFLMSFNKLAASNKTKTFYRLPLGPNQFGPEAITFDCHGRGPYVGISDGRVLRWQGQRIGWTEFAVTSSNRSSSCNGVLNSPMEKVCGRPLGLRFDKKTCELYIADSSFGLMKVGPNGGIASSLTTSANATLSFANGLDVDSDNKVVYFTVSSTRFHHWEAKESLANHDKTGRLMKYDAKTGNATILLKDLYFPNGIALSKNKDFILVGESTSSRILKFWLTGPKAGTSEVFLQLKGIPDNINRDEKGNFWITLLQMEKSIKVNKHGKILDTLGGDEIINNPTDVQDFKGRIWIGYVKQPFVYHT